MVGVLALVACSSTDTQSPGSGGGGDFELFTGDPGKADSGWVSSAGFELGGVLSASVVQEASGSWSDLATNADKQLDLIDAQLRYGKNDMAEVGYHLNQLADEVLDVRVSEPAEGLVQLDYEISVDAIAFLKNGEVPSLAELSDAGLTRVEVRLPKSPNDVFARAGKTCASGWGGHSLSQYNYYYYFDLDQAECELGADDIVSSTVEITEVFEPEPAYPEYDRLLQQFDDGSFGFRAALVPANGDSDRLGRFELQRRMLEEDLGLTGTDVFFEDDPDKRSHRHYDYEGEGVRIEIDLYEPASSFTSSFHQALGEYDLVFYNGHSGYGTKALLNNAEAYPQDRYQIVIMWSCRSWEYYARQVFRAKAREEDPKGWANADMVASGKPTYAYNAPRTLEPILRNLLKGIEAEHNGRDADAPSWQVITQEINAAAPGFLYGAAGTRENAWQPAD